MGEKLRNLLLSKTFAIAISILSTLVVIIGILYFYFIAPHAAAGIEQPIPFSHRVHVTVKEIDCRFCHYSVERSPHAGLPSTTKCLYCHQYVIHEHPKIRRIKAYHEAGEPPPWRKVTWLPDHVYFSHQRHIRKEVDCFECHGQVEWMDRVVQVHEFKMGFCVQCHRERGASLNCWACHE